MPFLTHRDLLSPGAITAGNVDVEDPNDLFEGEDVEDVLAELAALSSGLILKVAVRLATATALPANTYDNGADGVGATLTADANGALTVDGVAAAAGNRILVQDEVDETHNGPYVVTNAGAAGAAYVLTRTTDGDTGDELFSALYFVTAGSANAGKGFYLSNAASPTIGTDALTYTEYPAALGGGRSVQVSAPLSKNGNTLGLGAINSQTAKTTLAGGDNVQISDSAASHAPKKITVTNFVAVIWTLIASLTGKTTPADADTLVLSDSAASNLGKSLTWANLKTAVFGAVNALTGKTTPVDADELLLSDSEAGNVGKKLTWANVKATLKTYFDTLYGTLAQAKEETLVIACSDETTDLTTGTAKVTFRMPWAFTLTDVRSSVTTAPTDAALIVDINEDGVSLLSTKLSIDATEKTSQTAATPAVISDSAIADDSEITIDIDQIGSTVAGAGLKVYLIGTRA